VTEWRRRMNNFWADQIAFCVINLTTESSTTGSQQPVMRIARALLCAFAASVLQISSRATR
jgi:hypothetical protein